MTNDVESSISIASADRLLTTTKQVRKRLDLRRPVPRALLLECIDITSHAPMGGNLERNEHGADRAHDRMAKVVESTTHLIDHIAEMPAWVIAIRLDRLSTDSPNFAVSTYHGSVAPGVWSFQLAARARGLGSAWTTFHLGFEDEVAEILGIPETVTQVALLPIAYYTGGDFTPAPRRPAREITYFNHWMHKI